MNKIKIIAPLAVLALIIVAGTVLTANQISQAASNQTSDQQTAALEKVWPRPFEKPFFDEATRQAIEEAIAKGDYAAWAKLVENTPLAEMTEKITQDNFARFAEAHQLMAEGRAKFEAAQTIMDELGLAKPMGHHGMLKGFMMKDFKSAAASQSNN